MPDPAFLVECGEELGPAEFLENLRSDAAAQVKPAGSECAQRQISGFRAVDADEKLQGPMAKLVLVGIARNRGGGIGRRDLLREPGRFFDLYRVSEKIVDVHQAGTR